MTANAPLQPSPSGQAMRANGVGAALRRLLGRDTQEADTASAQEERADPVDPADPYLAMDRIRAFLSANGLPPSPENYALAHRLLIEHDPAIVHIVQRVMVAEGRLSAEAVARIIAEGQTEIPVAMIEGLMDEARDNLTRLSGIVGQSRDDAQAYGTALEARVDTLADGGVSQPLLAQFVELTRSVIGRTRAAEERMRDMGDQIDELRASLKEAIRIADMDPLTGLANRRAFERQLARAVATARADRSPVTLAFCDIDRFKLINDTHGHEVGDRILKFVSELLSREADEDTLVSRYGGEEFVLLFEHVPFATALAKVNELRLDLGARRLHVRESGEPVGDVTMSAGIAALDHGQSGEALMRAADRALYAAKERGRDRIVNARDVPGAGSVPHRR